MSEENISLPKILSVDDISANLRVIEGLLKEMDIELHSSLSGNDALSLALENDYALILLDVQMPDMNGFEVAAHLRAQDRTKDVPIIFITANSIGSTFQEQGYEVGAIEYIEKPIESYILIAKIKVLLNIWHKNKELNNGFNELRIKNHALQLAHDEQKQLASHDVLTNLYNRRLLQERLDLDISEHRRRNESLAYLAIDLDHFKLVNDTLGHDIGDLLLMSVAEVLKKGRREVDTVARVGGDEFIIVLSNIKEHQVATICEEIIDELSNPFQIKEHQVEIGASIGIVMYPQDASNSKELAKKADTSLYLAKENGRGCYSFYDKITHQREERRQIMMGALKFAVSLKECYLVYQPRVDVKSNKIVGMEALMRWDSPSFGEVPPVEFIPLFESMNLISKVTFAMLDIALQQFHEWLKINPELVLSFNFSPLQIIQPDLASELLNKLEKHQVPARSFELEITEGLVINNEDHACNCLGELREAGCVIALDDFGTGFSSLSYLKRLPVDILKIDQSFIQDILTVEDDKSLTEAIIGLAKIFHLDVVAEGVEKENQRKVLEDLNCQYYQGFHFSEPLKAQNFTSLLRHEVC